MAKRGSSNKQKIVLVALLGLLAVFWINRLFFEGSGGERGRTEDKAFSLGVVPPADMQPVDLAILDRLNVPVEVTRNIFDPVYRPPVVRPVIPPPPPAPAAGAGRPNPDYVPPPPPKPREQIDYENSLTDIRKFRFVGFIERKGVFDLFLAKDSDYYVTHAGETIVDGYYVKEIKESSITIADRAHKFEGKEPEVSIEADFQGKHADVITGTTAPYVGVGATGGGTSGGGASLSPDRSHSRSPASGGKRPPAQSPRGVGGVQRNPDQGAAQPPAGEEEEPVNYTGRTVTAPGGLIKHSIR